MTRPIDAEPLRELIRTRRTDTQADWGLFAHMIDDAPELVTIAHLRGVIEDVLEYLEADHDLDSRNELVIHLHAIIAKAPSKDEL